MFGSYKSNVMSCSVCSTTKIHTLALLNVLVFCILVAGRRLFLLRVLEHLTTEFLRRDVTDGTFDLLVHKYVCTYALQKTGWRLEKGNGTNIQDNLSKNLNRTMTYPCSSTQTKIFESCSSSSLESYHSHFDSCC